METSMHARIVGHFTKLFKNGFMPYGEKPGANSKIPNTFLEYAKLKAMQDMCEKRTKELREEIIQLLRAENNAYGDDYCVFTGTERAGATRLNKDKLIVYLRNDCEWSQEDVDAMLLACTTVDAGSLQISPKLR